MFVGLIYCAKCKITGMMYIGQTTQGLETRRKGHEWDATKKSQLHFHCALRKYGFDNFEWSVLKDGIDNDEDLDLLEIHFIRKLGTLNPKGYNLTEGGQSNRGYVFTEDQKFRMSLIMQEVNERPGFLEKRGKKISEGLLTPESKAKRSKVFKEVMNRPEVKKQLSENQLANQQDPEYRKMMSAAMAIANKRPEVIKNRSEGQKNKPPESAETKAKRAAGIKAAWARRKAKELEEGGSS